MGYFVEGEWKSGWYPSDESGAFQRPQTTFRSTIESLQADRYHLYVSWACPWAHRVLIARSVLGLADKLPVSVVDWFLDDDGWRFHPSHPFSTRDQLFGFERLRQVYLEADPSYSGRVTVPVLFDVQAKTIVNNESREILRLLGEAFQSWHGPQRPCESLAPEHLRGAIDEVLDAIYEPINNGVYKAGFATSQEAYEQAVDQLFEALDRWEQHLADRQFLIGEQLTEADVCLFTTLIRFDLVYFVHFKCSRRRIRDYPNLSRHLARVFSFEGVAETCQFEHIAKHYYQSHRNINPYGIVAAPPSDLFFLH